MCFLLTVSVITNYPFPVFCRSYLTLSAYAFNPLTFILISIQTPDGSLLDIIRNASDLLSQCDIEIPQVHSFSWNIRMGWGPHNWCIFKDYIPLYYLHFLSIKYLSAVVLALKNWSSRLICSCIMTSMDIYGNW